MAGTYKMIELVGTSEDSFADAVRNAVAEAGRTVRHLDWFEVVSMRGAIRDDSVTEFQVTVKIGFKVEAEAGGGGGGGAAPKRGRGRGK